MSGQTNVDQKRHVEILLITYTSILIIIGLWVTYVYCIQPLLEIGLLFISGALFLWQVLDYGYLIGHALMCTLSILQRRQENEILMEFENIQNTYSSYGRQSTTPDVIDGLFLLSILLAI